MVQCEGCGFWRDLDEIAVMDRGPRTGAWICDDCWVGTAGPSDTERTVVGERKT